MTHRETPLARSNRELDARVKATADRSRRRAGHHSEVRIRHVAPWSLKDEPR